MKVSQSKLLRKLSINRRSNRLSATIKNKPECVIEPIKDWWKARNVKDTLC